jgi:hypothetical protein
VGCWGLNSRLCACKRELFHWARHSVPYLILFFHETSNWVAFVRLLKLCNTRLAVWECFSKIKTCIIRLVEETKEGKKERKIVNNNEIHHISVGTRHKETPWKLLDNTRQGKRGKEVRWKGVTLTGVQCMYRYNTKAKMLLNNEQILTQWRTRMKNRSR